MNFNGKPKPKRDDDLDKKLLIEIAGAMREAATGLTAIAEALDELTARMES